MGMADMGGGRRGLRDTLMAPRAVPHLLPTLSAQRA